MQNDPVAALVAKLEQGGFAPRPTGSDSWESRCPAHGGRRRNLSVKKGDDGRALVFCHHAPGCSPDSIMGALGLSLADLFPERNPAPRITNSANSANIANEVPREKSSNCGDNGKAKPRHFQTPELALAGEIQALGPPSPSWAYQRVDGTEVLRVYRFDYEDAGTGKPTKTYRPVHLTSEGWLRGDPPSPLPLYRLPDLADARAVYVCEGEKAADAVQGLGLVATTSAHGAQSPHKTDWSPLAGKSVVILPDHDAPGESYAQAVATILARLNPLPRVKILHLADLWRTDAPIPEGGDIIEWIADGVPDTWTETECRVELDRLAGEWPPLLLDDCPAVEPFPVDVYPRDVAHFVRGIAGSIGCPEDFVGLPVLIVAGAAIGRSVSLRLRPNHFTSASLYGMNIGGPSSGKSPALEFVTKPFWVINRELLNEYKQKQAEYEDALKKSKGTKGSKNSSK